MTFYDCCGARHSLHALGEGSFRVHALLLDFADPSIPYKITAPPLRLLKGIAVCFCFPRPYLCATCVRFGFVFCVSSPGPLNLVGLWINHSEILKLLSVPPVSWMAIVTFYKSYVLFLPTFTAIKYQFFKPHCPPHHAAASTLQDFLEQESMLMERKLDANRAVAARRRRK